MPSLEPTGVPETIAERVELSSETPQVSGFIPHPSGHPSTSRWQLWLALGLFSVLWLDFIRLLSGPWETREQYAYGWFVPVFAAALLFRRWPDRPAVSSPWSAVSRPPFLLSAFCFLLCLSLLPLRVIYEINQDWPLVSWIYGCLVVGLTLYAIYLAGGWPWVKHFGFPVALIFIAIVWPYRIEKALIQGLMQVVASITVEILGWLNIPAMQRGNLIELGTGTLGVDEACSGIRSFQSSIMAGLVMGELYRMRILPRLTLIAGGVTLGFCLNVVRTTLLSWQANKNGLSAIDKWHDPAGMTITVACFFGLWAIAVLMTKWSTSRATLSAKGESNPPPPISHLSPLTSESATPSFQVSSFKSHPSPPSPQVSGLIPHPWFNPFSFQLSTFNFLFWLGLWSLLCIGATEAWYRSHTVKDAGVFHWAAAMPEKNPTYQKIELPPRTLKLLSFDEGASAKWSDDGAEWSAHFFRWNPRSVESVITSRVHRPERCLPASGFKQVSESDLVWYDAGNLKLPFRKYVFRGETQTLFVFFCQWEDGSEKQAGMGASNQEGRLQSVLSGRRKVGQQTLELVLVGYDSLETAEQAVRKRLPDLVRIDTQSTKTQASAN